MAFEEEINAPERIKQTRCNKLKMCGDLKFMLCLIKQMENQLYGIPEKDDPRHVRIIENLTRLTEEAKLAVEKAAFYKGSDV